MAEIGSVGAADTTVSRRTERVIPGAFGEGVSTALNGIAQTLAQNEQTGEGLADAEQNLSLAYRNKERARERAAFSAEFIRLGAEMQMESAKLAQSAGPGAAGLTDTIHGAARKRYEEFAQRLPDYLRDEFTPRIESSVMGLTTNGFEVEQRQSTLAYIDDVTDTARTLSDGILAGQISRDQAYATMEDLLENTPLNSEEAETLYESVQETLDMADLRIQAETRSQDVGTLAGRIMQLESGGKVDAQNPMPNQTAGGLGGFIDSTWLQMFQQNYPERAAGMTEPEIIALKFDGAEAARMTEIAVNNYQSFYRSKGLVPTDGQIYAAHFFGPGKAYEIIRSDPNLPISDLITAEAYEVNPNLHGKTVGQVMNMLEQKMGGATALALDDRYASLPYDTRMAAITDAQNAAQAGRARALQEQQRAKDSAMQSLQIALSGGEAGLTEVTEFIDANPTLTLAERERLNKTYEEYNEREVAFSRAVETYNDAGYVFDGSDAGDRKHVEALYSGAAANEIAEQTPGAVQEILVPQVVRTGIIPSAAINDLSGMALSSNPAQMQYGLDGLVELMTANRGAFVQSTDSRLVDKVATYAALRGYLPQEQINSQFAMMADPAFQQVRTVREQEVAKIRRESPQEFSPTRIARGLGLDRNLATPQEGAVMAQDYAVLFQQMYTMTGDEKLASEVALSRMADKWGETRIGGDTFTMRYPPEMSFHYPTMGGSHDWIDEQIKADLTSVGIDPDRPYRVISDARTEAELKQGERPGYMLMTEFEPGIFIPVYDNSGRPARVNFEVTAEMRSEARAEVRTEHNRTQIQDEMFELDKELALLEGQTGADRDPEAIEALRAAIRDLGEDYEAADPSRLRINMGAPE